jgi:hypothetical protein
VVRPILAAHATDITWIEERLGASMAENLSTDPEGAVSSEDDLLKPSLDILAWLAARLGGDKPAKVGPDLPAATIAAWVHELRLQVAAGRPSGRERDASRLAVRPVGGRKRREVEGGQPSPAPAEGEASVALPSTPEV